MRPLARDQGTFEITTPIPGRADNAFWKEEVEHASGDSKKYIISLLMLRQGVRGEFMTLPRPYVASCRRRKGDLFFEMSASESGRS